MSAERWRTLRVLLAGTVALVSIGTLWSCEGCSNGDGDLARSAAIARVRNMEPVNEETTGAWLTRDAGWRQVELAYYNAACAMPRDASRREWLALSPSSFERFEKAWTEAVLAGVEVRSILIRDDGVSRWHRDARAREPLEADGPDSPLAAAIREGLREQVIGIAECLEAGRFEESRRVLRDGIPRSTGR